MPLAFVKKRIRRLYEGAMPISVRFRYALLAFDIVTVLFIVATSFLPSDEIIETLDVLFGVVILADFSARLLISRHRLREFTRFSTWTDLVPGLPGRSRRLSPCPANGARLREYQVRCGCASIVSFFRRNEEVILL
jgi:voltage-gated potassium channel